MWEWSDEGRIPIILDSSSCSYTIKSANTHLDEKIMFKYKKLKFLDIVEYCHDYLINRFNIKRIEEKVVLHPNCSIVKMGLTDKMITIAEKCSSKVIIPKNLGCCGFAGDRGLLFPELTQKASHCEAQETIAENANLHYSSNVTCEIAMNEATGKQYLSILYLLEKVIEK
jgi:D-lactate dehydrogenase